MIVETSCLQYELGIDLNILALFSEAHDSFQILVPHSFTKTCIYKFYEMIRVREWQHLSFFRIFQILGSMPTDILENSVMLPHPLLSVVIWNICSICLPNLHGYDSNETRIAVRDILTAPTVYLRDINSAMKEMTLDSAKECLKSGTFEKGD